MILEIRGKVTTSHLSNYATFNNCHLIKSHGGRVSVVAKYCKYERLAQRQKFNGTSNRRDSYDGTAALARRADGVGSCGIFCTQWGRRILLPLPKSSYGV